MMTDSLDKGIRISAEDVKLKPKRNVNLHIKLSEAEKKALDDNADALGVTVSELVRKVLSTIEVK